MVATLIEENGAIVLSRVVEAPVQEADHAPIPLRSTVEKTACPWDRVRKLGLAMKVLVHNHGQEQSRHSPKKTCFVERVSFLIFNIHVSTPSPLFKVVTK